MELRQTKLVESVGLLFQTRVQFPPSPQYTKISPYGEIFCGYSVRIILCLIWCLIFCFPKDAMDVENMEKIYAASVFESFQ